MLFGDWPNKTRKEQMRRVLADVQHDRLAAEGLLVADREGRIVGAGFGRIYAGRTAAALAPRLVAGEPEATAQELLTQVDAFFREHRVVIAQTLLETDHGVDADRLLAAGFRHMADLLYLVASGPALPDAPPATELEFETYTPQAHERLCGVVEQTYIGTRDCPELNGLRDTPDVLAGFEAIGVFDSRRWLLARHGGRDIGCVLLADHPDLDQWELVYMGLAADARGRGWGIQLVRQAQWLTRCAGRPRIVLAVDAANVPAISAYSAAGFVAWDRRSVFLRVF